MFYLMLKCYFHQCKIANFKLVKQFQWFTVTYTALPLVSICNLINYFTLRYAWCYKINYFSVMMYYFLCKFLWHFSSSIYWESLLYFDLFLFLVIDRCSWSKEPAQEKAWDRELAWIKQSHISHDMSLHGK